MASKDPLLFDPMKDLTRRGLQEHAARFGMTVAEYKLDAERQDREEAEAPPPPDQATVSDKFSQPIGFELTDE